MSEPEVDLFGQEFWDRRYRGGPVFSGDPNPWLVHYAHALSPGTALDVGCGEGADSLWLAVRGWHVTAVDISPVALARAARLAEDTGAQVVTRTSWQQADALHVEPPEARFDPAAWTIHAGGHARPLADPPHPAGHTRDVVLHAVRRPVDPAADHLGATADRPPGSYWSLDQARWVWSDRTTTGSINRTFVTSLPE